MNCLNEWLTLKEKELMVVNLNLECLLNEMWIEPNDIRNVHDQWYKNQMDLWMDGWLWSTSWPKSTVDFNLGFSDGLENAHI